MGKDKDKKDKKEKDKKDKDKKDKDKKDKDKKVKDKKDKDKKDKDIKKDKKDKKDKDKKKNKKKDKKEKMMKEEKLTKEEKKALKKQKKEKRDKLTKEEKKALKKKKVDKKKELKADLVNSSMSLTREIYGATPTPTEDSASITVQNADSRLPFQEMSARIREESMQAQQGQCGAEAKTAAEEWAQAGQQEGLQIWRIEQFHLVSVNPSFHGQFYSGDSYVVLNTVKVGNKLMWDIHFWIGEHSTQDEYGTAAYKTVELDEHLGGTPTQHREVQDYESELFLSYFSPGIQILKGGVDSGFTNTAEEMKHRIRLLKVKGKRHVHITEVPAECFYLNSGDVFVLDAGDRIYEWIGREAGPFEKRQAGDLATSLRDLAGANPTIVTLEEGRDDEDEEFWELLGGRGEIASADEGGDDMDADRDRLSTKKLLQLSDESGTLNFKEVERGHVHRSSLKSEDVFVFDTGFEIFVWVGKGASAGERMQAMYYAQEYLTTAQRPPYLPITKVHEGSEHQTFFAQFD